MNKFYFLASSALIAFSASAFPTPKAVEPVKDNVTRLQASPQFSKLKDTRAGDNTEDAALVGTWTIQLGDWYAGSSSVTKLFEAAYNDDGQLVFTPVNDDDLLPIVSTFDPETSVFTFASEYLGYDDGNRFYVYQKPFIYDWTLQYVIYQNIYGQYDAKTGTISFEPDHGIAWVPFKDAEGQLQAQQGMYYGIYDMEGATQLSGGTSNTDWRDLGMATFMDGWLLPAVGVNQFENQYEVPLQQDISNSNRYRLVNPYKYGPLAEYNEALTNGYIVFDVTDPKHVVFEMADAGFAWRDLGISTFYCYNTLGAAMMTYGYSAKEVIGIFGNEIPYSTFSNGEVFLGHIESVNDEGQLYDWYDATYGTQELPTGGAIWADGNGEPADMTARILFPGYYDAVETVEAESDGAAEYFNLQGVKIVNPAKGQPIIVRNGHKSRKIIF